MKKIISAAILVAACVSAHAETFNFSYTFADGQAISGSLSGHLNGDLVESVSDVHINFGGVDFSGALFGASWSDAAVNWNSAAGPVVSTNAAKNNFIFADANPQTDYANVNNYFYFVNGSSVLGSEAFALNCHGNCDQLALDNPTGNATWSLVAAPVPEPTSIAMLMAGLGVVGAVSRRRRQA
ncbi:PEP-CTERM sorting domain-containing protein [Duganella callida]|uniref:PEP-CTERM sorting domain-containing protein n=1 Tax=Duganella callida TaxID=2561932 RepID=A0A4Y9SDA0_9BURK|nr:PEP-CTERM sorting domain-containing protein [Duganella callida]TFW20300.1 PEP-CTERM sorting domain-containing protein [Duganella callida]